MARRFLNSSEKKDEGWRRLKGYSGEGGTFYVQHDTFIKVTSSTNSDASPSRNFTIRKRTLEESEQLQRLQKEEQNQQEAFDPRAKLKKVGVPGKDEKNEKSKKDSATKIERRNSKKKVIKKKKKNEKNVDERDSNLDELSESVKLREQSINAAADARAEDSDKLAQAVAEEAANKDQVIEVDSSTIDKDNVDIVKQPIEIVIEEVVNDEEHTDNATDIVPPTPDLVRSSKPNEDTEEGDNKHEAVNIDHVKSEEKIAAESKIENLMNEIQKHMEEAKHASNVLEENVKLAKEQALITENASKNVDDLLTEEVDIDAVFAAAEASQMKSIEAKICGETINESIEKVKIIYDEISANVVPLQTPDLVRSSKINKYEDADVGETIDSDVSADNETKENSHVENDYLKTCLTAVHEMETLSSDACAQIGEAEISAQSAKDFANSLFETLKLKAEKSKEDLAKLEKKDILVGLIQKFYLKVEEARKEATLVAEKANTAAEKADIVDNIKNLIDSSDTNYEDIDFDTVVEAAELSQVKAD